MDKTSTISSTHTQKKVSLESNEHTTGVKNIIISETLPLASPRNVIVQLYLMSQTDVLNSFLVNSYMYNWQKQVLLSKEQNLALKDF